MSAKTQHNNILLAVLGFTAAVAIVGVIGFFAFGKTDEIFIKPQDKRTEDYITGRMG